MVEYSKLQNGSDIRGVALPLVAAEPVNLTEEAAGQIGRAFAAWLVERCGKPAKELRIAVGRDSRLSGPSLQRAVLTGLVAMGAVRPIAAWPAPRLCLWRRCCRAAILTGR